ncbi:condensation domain-containing protein [Shigella flexneri]
MGRRNADVRTARNYRPAQPTSSACTAQALMQADSQAPRVDSGKPLVFHQLIQVADNRWYWYQRYHHLLVDGFQSSRPLPATLPIFTAHGCVANQRWVFPLSRLSLM